MNDHPPFGTVFGPVMATATWSNGKWSKAMLGEVAPLAIHPAAHVLHYGSACFEGLKAHRGDDGDVRIFQLGRHVDRMRASAARLCLPVPDPDDLSAMVMETVTANLDVIPTVPGSLYLRPTLVGTAANIGAAGSPSAEALLYVLTSPVGDYFAGGMRPLRIAVETGQPRTTPQFGSVKAGANYAMALGATMDARATDDADQVLFCPDGVVQETGASNVLLIDADRVVTPAVDGSFLEGVTRASVLQLAADHGMAVDEHELKLDELLTWADHGEIALAGTAAVLTPVGTLVVDGVDTTVGDGGVGEATARLRGLLIDVQTGRAPDRYGWTVPVG